MPVPVSLSLLYPCMYAFRAGVTVGPTLRTIVRGMDIFHADGVVARPPLATRPGVGMLDSEPLEALPLEALHLVARTGSMSATPIRVAG